MTRSSLPILVFAVLVLAAGTLQGLHSNRWHSSADLEAAVGRLNGVPESFGNWRGEKQEFDVEELKRAGIKGHAAYRYRNIVTGEQVTMLIVCGRFGPISVHTPDICYAGAGYEPVGKQTRKEITVDGGTPLSVWALRFKTPPTVGSSEIEVNWVWNGGAGWVAPENSRWTFSGNPALYKMYVIRQVSALESDKKEDVAKTFLRTFLPTLEKVLAR